MGGSVKGGATGYLIRIGCQNQRLTVHTVSIIRSIYKICLLHWTTNLQTSVLQVTN